MAQKTREFSPEFLWGGSLPRTCAAILAIIGFTYLMEESMHYIGFFNQEGQAIWWPTNGLALALMVRSKRSHWPLVLAGTLLGSLTGLLIRGWPLSSGILNVIANSVGPAIGAFALPRFKRMEDWLQEPHLVLRYAAFALVLAPAVSAAIYASKVHLFLPGLHFWHVFQARANSDMLGYAIFTPLVLVFTNRETYRQMRLRDVLTLILLLGFIAGATYLVFWQTVYPLAFVLIAVIMLVALRRGFAASVLAMNLLAVLATIATMHGYGPLTFGAGATLNPRILLLQAFLALVMITVFSVSVVQAERRIYYEQLQAAYQEMEKLATTDVLTGLANRRLFEQTLNAEWARAVRSGKPLALLLIDVDNFKAYNDRFGHLAGDARLCRIAQVIFALEYRSSDLFARYGGEEFVLLLPETSLDAAAQVAESIRLCVENMERDPQLPGDRQVSVSIGCAAVSPHAGIPPETLINTSDEALYRAKHNGRNRVETAGSSASAIKLKAQS